MVYYYCETAKVSFTVVRGNIQMLINSSEYFQILQLININSCVLQC